MVFEPRHPFAQIGGFIAKGAPDFINDLFSKDLHMAPGFLGGVSDLLTHSLNSGCNCLALSDAQVLKSQGKRHIDNVLDPKRLAITHCHCMSCRSAKQ